jgi:hypothetical protein
MDMWKLTLIMSVDELQMLSDMQQYEIFCDSKDNTNIRIVLF